MLKCTHLNVFPVFFSYFQFHELSWIWDWLEDFCAVFSVHFGETLWGFLFEIKYGSFLFLRPLPQIKREQKILIRHHVWLVPRQSLCLASSQHVLSMSCPHLSSPRPPPRTGWFPDLWMWNRNLVSQSWQRLDRRSYFLQLTLEWPTILILLFCLC